jgi:hypothetical protein
LNKAFLHFLPNLWHIFDDFSKFLSALGMLHFEKSSNNAKNLAKNEEKPRSSCLKPISSQHLQNPKHRHTRSVTKKIKLNLIRTREQDCPNRHLQVFSK